MRLSIFSRTNAELKSGLEVVVYKCRKMTIFELSYGKNCQAFNEPRRFWFGFDTAGVNCSKTSFDRLRVVVKDRRKKTTTCKTSVEVVVPKGHRTTTSEVREVGAFGNACSWVSSTTKTDSARTSMSTAMLMVAIQSGYNLGHLGFDGTV
jgi:hypothetical protein